MARELTSESLSARQKARAQRVDHDYHRKPHPWRTSRKFLNWLLPSAGLVALGAFSFLPSGDRLYLPGPVSTKHAIFGDRCFECHDQGADAQGNPQWGTVRDGKCIACHDGPAHHPNMVHAGGNTLQALDKAKGQIVAVQTATCASCHTEHRGQQRLADIPQRHCTQCHADLKVTSGGTAFKSGIADFSSGHPDFRGKVEKDKTPLKLNHSAHVDKVKWPSGTPKAGATLSCVDCHQPSQGRGYMAPVNYEQHCQVCHPIAIPPIANVGEVKLPHEKAELVSAVVRYAFGDYLIKNNGQLPARLIPNPKYKAPRPGQKAKEPEFLEEKDARTTAQWLQENIVNTLRPMFFPETKELAASCNLCHVSEGKNEATGLPKILDPKIPNVWYTHSVFNHESHRVIHCASCHEGVEKSATTEDVLLPGIQNCQNCHSPSGGARSGCVECHLYHDKALSNFTGMRTLQELTKGLDLSRAKDTPEAPAGGGAETKAPAQPETKAEPKPEPKVEPKAEPKPEPKVEPKPEPKAEPKAEPPPAPPEPAPPAAGGVVEENTILCKNCGMRWPLKVKYCARCGNNLAVQK